MELLNIPMPNWIPITFFVVLLGAAYMVGSWLEKGEQE
jgi:hypothetical protein